MPEPVAVAQREPRPSVWCAAALVVLATLLSPAPAAAVSYVRSVEYVEVNLAAGATTASVNLTKGQVAANCVPFASMMVSGTDDQYRRVFTDLYFQTAPLRVTAQRSTSGGTLSVGVFVVEFDPAFVNVQQGTFSMFAGNATATAPIAGVNLTKAALVSYYTHLAVTASWSDYAVAGWFSAGNQITWQRHFSASNVDGHYYVFEAKNAEFSVQALSFTVAAGASSATAAIASVDMDKSFVIASYRTAQADDDNEDGQIGVFLTSPTVVTAQRQFQSGSALISDVRAFVVQLDGNVRVQRGTLSYAEADLQKTAALLPVNTSFAMAWNGVSLTPGAMESEATAATEGDTGFQRLKLANATTLQGDRGESCGGTDCAAVGHFEVVDFEAIGGMRVKSGSYTGSGLARSITGIGFQPDVVIVDGVNAGNNSVIRTNTMANPNSKEIDANTALVGGQITSLDADGFSLGTDTDVNQNGFTYYWVAFKAGAGCLKVGTYAGAAVAQDVTGVGFSPDYVIVMSPNAANAIQKSSLMPASFSEDFAGGGYSNSILDVLPDGFRVGTHASVGGAGVTFHYVAWNATAGQMAVGRYVGNKADGRNITGAGFQPEYVIVDRSNDVGAPTGSSVGNAPAHKTAASGMNTDSATLFQANVSDIDNIQALQADGFQVGTHCRVNGDGTCNVPVPVAYYWMAFGPHVPKINYRSIGVAANFAGLAGDNILVTNGSTNVSKTAGAGWKTANRGRGDVLTVGANSYVIAAVNSDNQLTLASPAVANYGPGAYTIARQFRGGGTSYTALVNWEDCVDGPPGTACPAVAPVTSASLVADDRREIGIAYDDATPAFQLTNTFQFEDSITDATHDIRLTVDPGNRHNGVAGAGVVINSNGANEIDIRDQDVTLEWLEIVGATGDNIAAIQIYGDIPPDGAYNVLLQNLLIHNFGAPKAAGGNATNGIDIAGTSTLPGLRITIRNTMIWDGDDYAIEGDAQTFDTMLIENVSIDGMKSAGIHPGSTVMTIRNTIVTGSPAGRDFDGSGTTLVGSHNTSSDGTAALYFSNALSATAAATFVTPNVDLHLLGGATAVDSGLDLSPSFGSDIDGQLRPAGVAWDRGADERGATTAVKLQSFAAIPGDASLRLEWRTGSELDNLGFYVYRGLSENGPWTRLTSSLIPGLGSSAIGQAYAYRDTGLRNGTQYFYRLEDVDASSSATSHGPVSAVPLAGAPGVAPGREPPSSSPGAKRKGAPAPSCPEWVVAAYGATAGSASASLTCTRHGDPEAVSLAVLSRDSRQATIELRTGGFYALHEASGRVRVFVPGFDFPEDPQAPALPFRRALVDAVVGRRAQLGGVRALVHAGFPGLVPAALGGAEMQVSWDGTVRAGRRSLRELAPQHVSTELARLLPSVFQAETKSAVVALTPLRYDARRKQIVLAKRLLVRLLFTGRETGESGRGSSGRRPRPEKPAAGELLARLYTTSPGLYALRFEQVFPGGGRGVAASALRLERQGQAQPFHVEPASDAFGPGSVLCFHADAVPASTDFSSEVAWELLRARDGVQMAVVPAAPSGAAVASASIGQAAFESDRFYQPGLLDAPDPWLWEALASGATRTKTFTLAGVNVASSQAAELEVLLQGASESGREVDHHVSVSLGGVLVGEAQFAGKQLYRMTLSLPVSLLHEGANDLSLANVADTGVSSLVFLDRFTVTYPQASSLATGVFEGTWAESGSATVSGAAAALLDVTPSGGARWLSGYEASGGALRFRAEAGHRYLAVAPSGLLTPRVAAPAASSLRETTNQADYLLIAPRAFLAAAEPLLERRRDQGLEARAVAFEEIADAFGHGQPSAEAIRSFLAFAFQSWARPSPRYVLLLGDSSYDPRNFIGTSPPSPLPALWTKTSYLWTVSDPLLAAVNGDDALPDLAIGRLPAATVEEAQRLVEKLLAWEDSGQGLSGAAALVADNPDLGGRLRGGRARHRAELPRRQGSPAVAPERARGRCAARDPGRARLGPGLPELRRPRRGGGVGERERVELVGRGEPAGAVAPAAARDDELPERLLRGPGLRLADGVAAEGGRARCDRRLLAERAVARRPGAPVPPGADGRAHERPARAAGRRAHGRAEGLRRDRTHAGAHQRLPPLWRPRHEDPAVTETPCLGVPALPFGVAFSQSCSCFWPLPTPRPGGTRAGAGAASSPSTTPRSRRTSSASRCWSSSTARGSTTGRPATTASTCASSTRTTRPCSTTRSRSGTSRATPTSGCACRRSTCRRTPTSSGCTTATRALRTCRTRRLSGPATVWSTTSRRRRASTSTRPATATTPP